MTRPTKIQRYTDECSTSDENDLSCGALDERCNDPAFALQHPELCGGDGGNGAGTTLLVLRPDTATLLSGSTIQYSTFIVVNGVETAITSGVVYSSSNTGAATINSSTGLATGVASALATITATWHGLTAHANLNVTDECGPVDVVVVIDNSVSMNQAFGGSYATRLDFAKAAALDYTTNVVLDNTRVGVVRFSTVADSYPLSTDRGAIQSFISHVPSSSAFTDLGLGLSTAVSMLSASSATHKIIILLTDGEEHVPDNPTDDDFLGIGQAFKDAGGVLVVVGTRATGGGYVNCSALANRGYFANAYSGVETAVIAVLSALRQYYCSPCDNTTVSDIALVPTAVGPDGITNSTWGVTCPGPIGPGYGSATDSLGAAAFWRQGFDTAVSVLKWDIAIARTDPPAVTLVRDGYTVTFQGSNDTSTGHVGSITDWTTIDSFTYPYNDSGSHLHELSRTLSSPVSYRFYRVITALDITDNATDRIYVQSFCMYGTDVSASCPAPVQVEQLPDPSPLPNVEDGDSTPQSWTLTRSYTACCPPTQVGDCVTSIQSYTSTISEADADLHATALARSAAFSELACCGGMPIVINDHAPATPYPSCLRIAGLTSLIGSIKVHINGFSHAYPKDVGILLIGPTGDYCVLMTQSGCDHPASCPASNVNLVFQDGGTALPSSAAITSGTYAPTNHTPGTSFPSPAPVTADAVLLSVFNGTDPNGVWKLCVVDDTALDVGSITSWSVEIDGEVQGTCTGDALDSGDELSMVDRATVEAAIDFSGCDTVAGSPWDGTFVKAESGDTRYYVAANVHFGGAYVNAYAALFTGSNSECLWVLNIQCALHTGGGGDIPQFWCGVKPAGGGTTAAGRYFVVPIDPISGRTTTNTAPAYIDLVAS